MASITTDAVTTVGTFISENSSNAFSLGTARSLAIGATTANIALTPTCQFVSIKCAGGTHCHYTIGTGAQTATSSSHYLRTGERLTLQVPANANIAVIQGTGAATTLYISEFFN